MPKDKTLKTNSIYYRFLKLLALAFVTAALFSSFSIRAERNFWITILLKQIIWSGKMRGDTMICGIT